MNQKKINLIVILMLLSLIYACTTSQTEVAVCGTLHSYHKKNPAYSYEKLYQFIESYNPDIIGIEIRPEDIDSSAGFLRNYYPREMVEVKSLFAHKKICGIDWWNASLYGKGMSDDLISSVDNIIWEQAYLTDTVFLKTKPDIIESLLSQKLQIAAKASIKELVTGDYDSLNIKYYEELGKYMSNSEHERLYQSYMKRHEKIAQNMVDVVDANPGRKILFLTGVDHQVYGRQKLEEIFGDDIRLNSPFE